MKISYANFRTKYKSSLKSADAVICWYTLTLSATTTIFFTLFDGFSEILLSDSICHSSSFIVVDRERRSNYLWMLLDRLCTDLCQSRWCYNCIDGRRSWNNTGGPKCSTMRRTLRHCLFVGVIPAASLERNDDQNKNSENCSRDFFSTVYAAFTCEINKQGQTNRLRVFTCAESISTSPTK